MSFPFQRRLVPHYIFQFQLGGSSFWFSTYSFTLPLPSIIPPNATWYQLLQVVYHGAHTLIPLPHLLYLTQLCHHLQNSTNKHGPQFSTTPPTKTQFAPLAWTQSGKWSKCMHMVFPLHIYTLVFVKTIIFNKSHPMTNKQNSHLQKIVHISHFYKIFSAFANWKNFHAHNISNHKSSPFLFGLSPTPSHSKTCLVYALWRV